MTAYAASGGLACLALLAAVFLTLALLAPERVRLSGIALIAILWSATLALIMTAASLR